MMNLQWGSRLRRRSLLLSILLFTVVSQEATLASSEVDTDVDQVSGEVTSVTLYSSHARIERTLALVPGESGIRTVSIGPLSSSIIDESIEVEGGESLSAISVQVNRSSGDPIETPEETEKRDALKQLEQQLLSVQRTVESQKKMRERFARLLPVITDDDEEKKQSQSLPPMVQWQRFLDMVKQGMSSAAAGQVELTARIRDLTGKIEQLRGEVQELTRKGNRSRAVIKAVFHDAAGTGGVIRVKYLIPQAYWFPHYEIDVDLENSSLEVRAFAMVSQTTGEDWPEVPVHFSTSTPEQGADLPELASVILSRERFKTVAASPAARGVSDGLADAQYQWGRKVAGRPALKATEKLARTELGFVEKRNMDYGIREQRRSREVLGRDIRFGYLGEGGPSDLSNRGFLRVFSSVKPEAIPSDGQQHRLLYSVKNLPFKEVRISRPEIRSEVFRRIIAPLSGNDPLLRGTVSVFLGDDYLGQALIETTAPGEELELDLGVDDQMVMKRIERQSEDQVGFFSKSDEFETDLQLQVTNFHRKPVTVEVGELIPFSESELIKIRVDRAKTSPLPSGLDSTDGLLSWNLEIPAGETVEIRLVWYIEAPPNVELEIRAAPERSGREQR